MDFRINYDQGTDTWVPLSIGVTTLYYTASNLTPGVSYKFTVEARNTFSYSLESDVIEILCATIPATPQAPLSTISNGDVVFSWPRPSNQGTSITAYTLTIRQADNLFTE